MSNRVNHPTNNQPCRTSFLLTLVFATSTLSNCGEREYKMSAPFTSVVVAFTGNNANGQAQYAVTEKTFRTLNNFNELDGQYLRIRRGGSLTIKDQNGSLVSSENFSGGMSPALRYRVTGGVAIPLDYSTLAMLSSYYQIDEIYSTLQEKLGIDPSALQGNLPEGKHTMLFEPEIVIKSDGNDVSAGIKLNAAFSPTDKKFLLFQRSPIESVPLAANFQVLSHEFGHFLFDYSFFAGKYTTTDRWKEEYALSGINEGFADFVSWTFTDNSDILRSSINIDSLAIERNFAKTTFGYGDLNAEDPPACGGKFYCIGTLFARSLYQAQTNLSASVSKTEMAKGVIETLQKCQDTMNALGEDILPAQAERDNLTFSQNYTRDGKIIGAFLRSFAGNAPTAWKTELCGAFKSNFDMEGFPEVARAGVCD